jgi:quercetin dioxygenase-like cupin family protein
MTKAVTLPALFFPAAHELAVFDDDGPRPQFLLDTAQLKVLVAGLEAGQQISAHAEGLVVYHFLAGEGVMTVDGETLNVQTGATVIAPAGAVRGMRSTSRLAFLAVKRGEM